MCRREEAVQMAARVGANVLPNLLVDGRASFQDLSC